MLCQVADFAGLSLQDLMVKQDGRCGSTVGPKLSASLAMVTADIGVPQLAMHS